MPDGLAPTRSFWDSLFGKDYTSPAQKVVDYGTTLAGNTLAGPFGGLIGPSTLDTVTRMLPKGDYPQDLQRYEYLHPEGVRRGSVENLVKSVGSSYGNLVNQDMPYLEQYFHPDKNVLRSTPVPSGRKGTLPYKEPYMEPGGYQNLGGLGGYSKVDQTGRLNPNNKDYIFDKWDFETEYPVVSTMRYGAYGDTAKKFLQYTGEPYAVFGKNTSWSKK